MQKDEESANAAKNIFKEKNALPASQRSLNYCLPQSHKTQRENQSDSYQSDINNFTPVVRKLTRFDVDQNQKDVLVFDKVQNTEIDQQRTQGMDKEILDCVKEGENQRNGANKKISSEIIETRKNIPNLENLVIKYLRLDGNPHSKTEEAYLIEEVNISKNNEQNEGNLSRILVRLPREHVGDGGSQQFHNMMKIVFPTSHVVPELLQSNYTLPLPQNCESHTRRARSKYPYLYLVTMSTKAGEGYGMNIRLGFSDDQRHYVHVVNSVKSSSVAVIGR